MDQTQKASLGCGSLIVILLIVIVFGNMGGKDAAEQVRQLRTDVQRLESTVSAQTREIDSLQRTVARLLGPATKPAATAQSAKATESQ